MPPPPPPPPPSSQAPTLSRNNSFWSAMRGMNGESSGSEQSSRHDESWPTYEWSPLDSEKEIRLMGILPAKSLSGPVECMISRFPRYATPAYEAISHSSDEQDLSGMVICQGKAVAVSASCEAAARALRAGMKSSKQPRRVWIAEICVNQADSVEKSAQTAHLADVFYYAQRTIMYLGGADATTSLIRNMFHDIEYDRWQLDRYLLHESRVVAAWKDFFARPWFNRTWIIPALMLSSELVFLLGNEELAWTALMHLVQERENAQQHGDDPKLSSKFGLVMTEVTLPYIVRLYKDLHAGPRPTRSTTPMLPSDDRRPPSAVDSAIDDRGTSMQMNYDRLFDLLESSSRFECNDPRDKLYAILPVFGNPVPELLTPNYNKSTAEVYSDLTRFLLKIDPATLLTFTGREASDSDLPSWIIDWRVPAPATRLPPITRRLHAHAGYRENPNTMRYKIRGPNLITRGRIIDVVKDLGETCPSMKSTTPDSEIPTAVFRDIEEWEFQNTRLVGTRQGFKPTVCIKDCAHPHLVPALVRNRLGLVPTRTSQTGAAAEEDVHEGITRMKDLISNGLNTVQQHYYSNGRFVNREKEKEFDLIAKRCMGRRLMVSGVGLSGLVPGSTRVGDYICIIVGCRLPFVLRPLGAGRWRLVGECIVGGILHGEAVAWLSWGNIESSVPEEPFCDFEIH